MQVLAPFDLQLAVDARQMLLDGADGDEQFTGDFTVGAAAAGQDAPSAFGLRTAQGALAGEHAVHLRDRHRLSVNAVNSALR